mgnify:CR=1 FL=1
MKKQKLKAYLKFIVAGIVASVVFSFATIQIAGSTMNCIAISIIILLRRIG